MTLTKSQIIEAIAKQNGYTRQKSTETVETIIEIIKSALVYGTFITACRPSLNHRHTNLGLIREIKMWSSWAKC